RFVTDLFVRVVMAKSQWIFRLRAFKFDSADFWKAGVHRSTCRFWSKIASEVSCGHCELRPLKMAYSSEWRGCAGRGLLDRFAAHVYAEWMGQLAGRRHIFPYSGRREEQTRWLRFSSAFALIRWHFFAVVLRRAALV